MSGDMLGAAIVFGALGGTVVSILLGATGMYEKDGPLANLFRDIRDGLVAGWCLIRNALWSLTHRSSVRKPYLSADTVERLEIECYVGPYAEPFRAESLKAWVAKRRRELSPAVRVIEPCERGDETAHIFAMNGRCILCGTVPSRTPEYTAVKLDGDTLANCLGDPNRDHHWWRTFRDLEGFHSKCLRCGVRQERTKVFG